MTSPPPLSPFPKGEARFPQAASGGRFPAEWSRHRATWLAWPHHAPDWPGKFETIPWVYGEIVRVLHAGEMVEILCADESVRDNARRVLDAHGVDTERVRLHLVPTDRVWTRDSGPTAVRLEGGGIEWVGWAFNAWAKYDNFARDARVADHIAQLGGLPIRHAVRPDTGAPLVLEGGGIETNGAGVLLVTEEWLLSPVQVRNPGLDRAGYEQAFARYLGIDHTVWLGRSCVGDDTHGHIDDVARFTDAHTIVLAYEADPSDANHEPSVDNLRRLELAAARVPGGLDVVTLPFPRAVRMDGERLPASYANFYIANDTVLVPTFNDPRDREAIETLAALFPTRTVVGIHAVDLVWGLGTLHCLTQQEPAAP
jgi:agmatine deiminase